MTRSTNEVEAGFPIGVAALGAAYLLGSIPFGYLLVRARSGVDIRTRGSGNIGATNVQRYLGTAAGLSTLLLDAGKGAAAVGLARAAGLGSGWTAAAGVVAVLGHSFPLFLRFRGGKGVATGAGVFFLLAPRATVAASVLFLLAVGASRVVSLGSVTAAIVLPAFAAWWYGRAEFLAAALVGGMVVIRHRQNIRNLLERRERRLGEEPGGTREGGGGVSGP